MAAFYMVLYSKYVNANAFYKITRRLSLYLYNKEQEYVVKSASFLLQVRNIIYDPLSSERNGILYIMVTFIKETISQIQNFKKNILLLKLSLDN